jgi:hypothetical protein
MAMTWAIATLIGMLAGLALFVELVAMLVERMMGANR